MAEDKVLTAQEVADLLKISKNTVYELIKRGELGAYKIGNKMRVEMSQVDAYKNKTKKRPTSENLIKEAGLEVHLSKQEVPIIWEKPQKPNEIVICGQDHTLDILSNYLQRHPQGTKTLRSYVGSYNGLYMLYQDMVQVATTHLWDGKTGEYNLPYIEKMLPGIPVTVIHIADRMMGYYVANGNPKKITSWEDLKRTDVTISNREKGSGTRILLDERLKIMKIPSSHLKGYDREYSSHLAMASAVSRGSADFALGIEKYGMTVKSIDFVPLQKERYDLVIKTENLRIPAYQAILEIIQSEEFRLELEGLGGYDLEGIGETVN